MLLQVFVNGVWVGVHRQPQDLVQTLKMLRRQTDVNTEVGGAAAVCRAWLHLGHLGCTLAPISLHTQAVE